MLGIALAIEAGQSTAAPTASPLPLEEAQRLFYSGRYEEAAALTRDSCSPDIEHLAACELRTSIRLFQIKRALGEPEDKDKAWKACEVCPALMADFASDLAKGQGAARARLQTVDDDERALFLLGKLDLNYVWLQLGTLGHKTGWREYWEARRSLDKVVARNPKNVRALVARAWIDYIVDTKMPRGTRWLLGGGDRKRGLATSAPRLRSSPTSSAERKRISPCGKCSCAKETLPARSSPPANWRAISLTIASSSAFSKRPADFR